LAFRGVSNGDTFPYLADPAMFVTTDKVGIGIISPEDKLHTDVLRIGDWARTGNGYKFSMDTNAYLRLQYMNGQTVYKDIMTLRYDNGNVGIGTTNPTAPLTVVSTRNADTWASDKSQLKVLNDNGAGSTYGMSFAVSQSRGDGIIQTFNNYSGGAQYDLCLQPNGGKVQINTTRNINYTLDVDGSIHYSGGGLNGSDDRIKYNEENVTNALDILGKLKPQKYEKIMKFPHHPRGTWIPTDENWETVKNSETLPWQGFTYENEFGFIAQDVRNIPELAFLVGGKEMEIIDESISPEEYNDLNQEEKVKYTRKFIYESNVITIDEYTDLTSENKDRYKDTYIKAVETQTPLALNYQGIFVVAVKGIQELDAQLQTTQTDLQTTRTQLEVTTLKLLNTEARLGMIEQTMTSILSKLNV
jgi:hypothetical protein